MSRIFLFLLILTFAQISCKGPQQSTSSLPALVLKDVAYGAFPSSHMDVNLPVNRDSHTPFAIIIHGGAWTLGDRRWGTRSQDTLALHGMASANIDYRYADNNSVHYQDLLKDIDSAVNYCIAHAKEWNTRTSNFVIIGESAGAHLALMYGYTTKGKIGSVIAQCAPTNIADTSVLNYYARKDTSILQAIAKMTGAAYIPGQAAPSVYLDASPIGHIKDLPTLAFHGTADPVVPYSQALQLKAAMEAKGYHYELVSMPGAGHDVGLNTAAGRALIYAKMLVFIEEHR